jgi:carotenoid 1,2-hydratase
MSLLSPLPDGPGSYGWYYADFSAPGCTAVLIFMVGAPFSPRRVRAGARGVPARYSAVNFALYWAGRPRRWVLSEYPVSSWEAGRFRIGSSWLEAPTDGSVVFHVRERTAWGGEPVEASLTLHPDVPAAPALTLVPGLSHVWQPLALRAHARLEVPTEGVACEGMGYLDSNRGEEPLAQRLPLWRWTRVHRAEGTWVRYEVPGEPWLEVTADEGRVAVDRVPAADRALGATRWGLRVPRALGRLRDALGPPRLLESSPFYARLEAEGPRAHAVGEVAHFRRFRSPLIRWMAHFRTRVP